VAHRRGWPPPNCDAALGALAFAADAEPGASEAIFAVARTAGWLAHAFEEADEPPLRFRGRTLYRGPRP
jgi:citrate synthase